MEGIREPVDRTTALVLRRAVLDHVRVERRRWFPPLLHVGAPGGASEILSADPDEALDHALRADLVAAMLHRGRRAGGPGGPGGRVPMLWLTRPGPLELQDVDAAWMSAARTATAEAGVGLTLVVVTRRGWFDPRSGVRREWKRLRQR